MRKTCKNDYNLEYKTESDIPSCWEKFIYAPLPSTSVKYFEMIQTFFSELHWTYKEMGGALSKGRFFWF